MRRAGREREARGEETREGKEGREGKGKRIGGKRRKTSQKGGVEPSLRSYTDINLYVNTLRSTIEEKRYLIDILIAKNINPKPLSGLTGYYIDSILYTKNDILNRLGQGQFNYKQYIFIKNSSGDIETVDTLPAGANIYPYAANVEDSILMTN